MPVALPELQFHRAGFILPKKFDSASAHRALPTRPECARVAENRDVATINCGCAASRNISEPELP